jgi:glycosyltransferase involved in cell wall biosynthesis
MHIPLGIAITEFLYETGIPAIAHHHDFYWERDRFSINAVSDYLDASFPPRVPGMQHVVINEAAQEQLSWRKGVPSMLVPNVLNFEEPPPPPDEYAADVREEIGLEPDDIMILQPTRVIPRKGIEHAIHLVEMLGDSRYKLIISHSAEDEGTEYCSLLQELARESGVDLRIIATRIGEFRQRDDAGNKIYTLADLYPHADMVTYPSLYEGFGNAFLEAIYYRIPVVVNRYSTFARDIEPKGFDVPVMNGFVTRDVVEQVRHIMEDREARERMVERNYEIARMFYSYSVLRNRLRTLITNVTGMT